MFTWTDVKPLPIDNIIARLQSRQPFAYSRWCDGEWRAVLGHALGANCDGHPYSRLLTVELRAVLEAKPDYWLGIGPLPLRRFPAEIPAYMDAKGLASLDWRNVRAVDDALIAATTKGDSADWLRFLRCLRSLPTLIIGPRHVHPVVHELIACEYTIECPLREAFVARRELEAEALSVLQRMETPTVVLISCGMTANILVDRIWNACNRKHIVYDIGSVWDLYGNVLSRSWMRAADKDKSLTRPVPTAD